VGHDRPPPGLTINLEIIEMARGMPSMLALLGLLAVAGYQNRDKIGAAIDRMRDSAGSSPGTAPASGGGLGGLLEGLGAGGLASGIGDLLNSFKTAGHGEVADSWVRPGVPTQPVTSEQVRQALGDENIDELSLRLGISREELLQRLVSTIPQKVDELTPGGRMPSDDEVRNALMPKTSV
jgi:uncharacterized protein YidB (DUF937 family)